MLVILSYFFFCLLVDIHQFGLNLRPNVAQMSLKVTQNEFENKIFLHQCVLSSNASVLKVSI